MRTSWTTTVDRLREARPALEAVFLGGILLLSILALAVAIVPAAEVAPAAAPEAPVPPAAAVVDSFAVTSDTSLVFVVTIGNRLVPEWKEDRRLRLQEPFVIGDTDNTGVVQRFLPDFRIIDGHPRSVSRRADNPAIRVVVSKGEAPVDSSWAFLNFPPHFSPYNFFTFQLEKIEGYGDAAPLAASGSAPGKEK